MTSRKHAPNVSALKNSVTKPFSNFDPAKWSHASTGCAYRPILLSSATLICLFDVFCFKQDEIQKAQIINIHQHYNGGKRAMLVLYQTLLGEHSKTWLYLNFKDTVHQNNCKKRINTGREGNSRKPPKRAQKILTRNHFENFLQLFANQAH